MKIRALRPFSYHRHEGAPVPRRSEGTAAAGDVIELPEGLGNSLIAAGYVEAIPSGGPDAADEPNGNSQEVPGSPGTGEPDGSHAAGTDQSQP
jgi:hypothetical protein